MIYYQADGITRAYNLTWTPPTEREDGTAYGDADHAGYELGYKSDPAQADYLSWVSVPAAYAVTEWPLTELNLNTEGAHEVVLRTVDTGGRVSIWSDPAVFIAAVANPNAPVIGVV